MAYIYSIVIIRYNLLLLRIKVFKINRLEPDLNSKYYKESKNALTNISNL